MRLLILGIDGGDARVLDAFEMPFYRELVGQGVAAPLTEDLFSRGWSEMVSGLHARDTKAFYAMPRLDGTRDLSLSYSLDDLRRATARPLIWELAERRGLKSGSMNIQGMRPAPPVDGFFVSGAGGGLNTTDGVPAELCEPKGMSAELDELGYEIDRRIKRDGHDTAQELVELQNRMMVARVDAFLKYAREDRVELGILVLRATSNIQYIAMSEIEKLIAGRRPAPDWEQALREHYKLLDEQLRRVFEHLEPQHHCIMSDHGSVAQRYHADHDVWLEAAGFQARRYTPQSVRHKLAGLAKNTIKPLLGRYPGPGRSATSIDPGATRAFAVWYYHGIYVNDARRFGGPVKEAEVDATAEEICAAFNGSQDGMWHRMVAKPYRSRWRGTKFADYLPDVMIDAPDEIFSLKDGGGHVVKNRWYGDVWTTRNLPTSMLTGYKGRHPLCLLDRGLAAMRESGDPDDLRLVYELTRRLVDEG